MFSEGSKEQLRLQWDSLEADKQAALADIRAKKQRNLITEDWLEVKLVCNNCKSEHDVLIDPVKWAEYANGGYVQDVWSEASKAYREQMIGVRSGYHICDDCGFWEDDDE